ncbi:hypothetical protein IT779_19550 [Nocardia sp. NEAU-351]|uniref:Mce protein n=1 Tax=Nocardia bovistercoris TaxID=2785916 RepID=A0A931N5B1_9NOCA|nr:hypothetical protein [Nocardia bovistercoris]
MKAEAPETESSTVEVSKKDAPAAPTATDGGDKGPSLLARIAKPARRALFPVTAAVAVAALVAVGIMGWQAKQQRDVDAAADAGLAAARAYAVTLTSVDTANLDAGFAAVLDGSTGEFRDMYTRSSGQLRQLLLDNKASGKGTVLDAAVKSASEDKVEVLLFIDQTVTNAASADPRVDRSRVAMTMERVGDRWLASRVYLP